MTEITKDKIISNLNELKRIIKDPELYFYEYFFELRSKVDFEIETKQMQLQDDEEKKVMLDKLKEQMIAKIKSIERIYEKTSFNLSCENERINEIEKMLETIDLNLADEIIDIEKINILQNLWKNKSIFFTKNWNTDGDLIILHDEFISSQSFKIL